MKAMKLALLGTAALAAASVSARADNLSDLKAQIEALNARVASLESTPSVPAGYSMVAFSKGTDIVVPGVFEGNKDVGAAHVISIMPTADAPAASTVFTWSGYVRGAVVAFRSNNGFAPWEPNGSTVDIASRAGLKVIGKTDTAVGEVGARIAFKATGNDVFGYNGYHLNVGEWPVNTDGYWGWWKMTPNLTLGAGADGSLSKNGQSFDAMCSCYYTDWNGAVGGNPWGGSGLTNYNGDASQIRLTYADGPVTAAIAVEDGDNNGSASAVGVAGKVAYSGDTFSADLSGGYWGTVTRPQAAWIVDAGIGTKMGMFSVGAAVGTGAGFALNSSYTKASGYASLSLSDAASLELGVAHVWNATNTANDFTEGNAGLYYTPVKQLTLGLEGMYEFGGANDGSYIADLVTVFRF